MRNTHILDMTEDDELELQREQLPGVSGGDGGSPGNGRPSRPLPPVATPPTPPPSYARSALPPEDMYDTELSALEAQLNSVPGIQRQAISREISQLQQLQAAAAKTATTPQPPGTPAPPAGTPLPVAYVLATGEPFKTKDGQLMELVSVAFTPSPSDPYFAGVDVWFTGYHGSKTPQLMTSGTTSPVSFLADITSETVTYTVQSFGSTGLSSAFASAPSATIALDGVAGAPPQPTVTQSLVQTPVGYQFEFSQEAGLAADVVSGYNVYRGTSSSFGSASKVDHIKQDPTNSGTVVWQDSQPSGVTMYYWLTAVNTSGLESAPTACQSGAVASGSGLNSAGQLVTGTPATPVSSLDSGASRANTAIDSGNVVVAAGIDLSRGYTNKNLDNVPPGSTYTALPITATSGTGTATKVNLAGAAGVTGEIPHANSSSQTQAVINGSGQVTRATPLDGGSALNVGNIHDLAYATSDGGQINSNPDFSAGATANYSVYDNNSTGNVALSAVADATVPNTSGYRLHIAVAAGSAPAPGIGGFTNLFGPDGGSFAPNTYHKGCTYFVRLRANIPTGYTIAFTSNQTGTGATYTPLTALAGTGSWFDYVWRIQIGTTGTFSSTGFYYLTGSPQAMSWDVAVCSWYCASLPGGMAVSSVDDARRALIDFSQTGHLGKDLDNILDGLARFAAAEAAADKTTNHIAFQQASQTGGAWTLQSSGIGYAQIPGVSLTVNVGVASTILVLFNGGFFNGDTTHGYNVALYVDGVQTGIVNTYAGTQSYATFSYLLSLSSGSHTIAVYAEQAPTDTFQAQNCLLQAQQLH